jgi:1-acyl-sn-glycerol-3-phosphate acyltransferase
MKRRPGLIVNVWHFILLGLLELLFRVLNRVEVYGQGHIPKRGERGVLILCNHISALDPLLIGATAMPRFSPVWWRAAAKEELFHSPLSRWIVRSIGAFPVRRGQHDEASIARMVESLKTDVLVVFPEGTWSKNGKLLPGRVGVGKVIYDARPAKVIPAAIKGTDQILPQKSFLPRVGHTVRIHYAAPIDLTRFYHQENTIETARDIVEAVMTEIRRLHEAL